MFATAAAADQDGTMTGRYHTTPPMVMPPLAMRMDVARCHNMACCCCLSKLLCPQCEPCSKWVNIPSHSQ
jgi:hypothetical protein